MFPRLEEANADGLLAIGGDLSVARLLLAYRSGVFPWYEEGQPILWWSPDPRMVLEITEVRVSKSLRKIIREATFSVTFNQNFSEVIRQCAQIKRDGQSGTWITAEMQQAYKELHALGHAISFEVWCDKQMVGGGYGIDLPEQKIFCGESMFSHVSNASKVGFVALVEELRIKGYQLIDCQVYTQHLERFGAKEITREEFVKHLNG